MLCILFLKGMSPILKLILLYYCLWIDVGLYLKCIPCSVLYHAIFVNILLQKPNHPFPLKKMRTRHVCTFKKKNWVICHRDQCRMVLCPEVFKRPQVMVNFSYYWQQQWYRIQRGTRHLTQANGWDLLHDHIPCRNARRPKEPKMLKLVFWNCQS